MPTKTEMNKTLTLDEARTRLFRQIEAGTHCPCCEQHVQMYRRKLHRGMALQLIEFVRKYKAAHGRWVRAPRPSGDFGKLEFWGLIEPRINTKRSTRTSGYWRPTDKGLRFVRGEIAVDAFALIYNNRIQGFEGPTVTISDCLGQPFSYEELMCGTEVA